MTYGKLSNVNRNDAMHRYTPTPINEFCGKRREGVLPAFGWMLFSKVRRRKSPASRQKGARNPSEGGRDASIATSLIHYGLGTFFLNIVFTCVASKCPQNHSTLGGTRHMFFPCI